VAKRTKNPLESKLETLLRNGIEGMGGMCIKFKDPARRGAPDRLILWPYGNRVCFVETKRPRGGVLADHQKRYHRDLSQLGQDVLVLWTEEAVLSFLDGYVD
jgi:hypothetical protein